MIELANVWHHYHVDPTLRGIDLTVQPGEVVCVMGPNGMGKSTLMKVTAGILPCFRGSVTIDGEVRRSSIEAEAAIRQKVVYLPDSPWQPRVTARQFLLASGRVYGVDEARLIDHSERLLQLFHLDRHADKRPEDLSAGQTKKLALCSALVTDAPIMLLDEPFSGGLDATGLRAVSELLKHAADDQHRTAMICVPVPELVEGLAHRVAVINHGQLVAFDTIEGLRRQTDCTGDLAEVLERLISEGDDPVQRYLTQEPTS